MYMRSRSSSKSKFHSHVRFSCPLTYNSMFKYSCRDQAFRLVVWDHPVLSFMVISTQPESARSVGSCQKFPWHGKNVMCENSPLFQHRYFLHNKFFVNDEFLQIHEWAYCWEDCDRLRSNATYRRFYIMSEVRLGDFAHNIGQWIILNHAIVYDKTIGCCIYGHVLLTFKV